MDDKEANRKIEQALKAIDDFKSWHNDGRMMNSRTVKFKQSDMENLLKEIVKILEK